MTRNEIHADLNLKMAEKQIFLWLTDNYKKGKEFYITHADIGKGVSVHAGNVYIGIGRLVKKGYIKRHNHRNTTGKCNSYVILK